MENSDYEACPTTSSEAVFHVELQKVNDAERRSGHVTNTNGTPDVTMRNSIQPLPSDAHDYDVTRNSVRRQGSMASSGQKDAELHQQGEADASDGPEVFTEEQFTPLTSSNQYQLRKMASQTLMDVALMMANISQLRTLIALGESLVQYYLVMMTLVIASLACQVVFAIFMFVMWIRESDQHQRQDFYDNLKELEQSKGVTRTTSEALRLSVANRQQEFKRSLVTNRLNYVTMILVFFITVTNMFITGFGIKTVEKAT